jgi:hypothetical protein
MPQTPQGLSDLFHSDYELERRIRKHYKSLTPEQLTEERRRVRLSKEKTDGMRQYVPESILEGIAKIPLVGVPVRNQLKSLETSYNKSFDEHINEMNIRKQAAWDETFAKADAYNRAEIKAERSRKSIPKQDKFRTKLGIKK